MLEHIAYGAVSGAVGTTLMSEVLAFARSAGLFPDEIPQEQIFEAAERKAGLSDAIPDAISEAGWISNHFSYGAVAGAVYGLLQGKVIRMPGAFVPAGAVFGLALWAIGFGGWAPLAGLYPPPTEDQPRKQWAEIAAHLVYGGATATLYWMLNRSRQRMY